MKEVKALLFDLGGVVIEIDFDRVLKRWEPISKLSFTELKATFHFDAAYMRHERGEIEAAEYFAHLRDFFETRRQRPRNSRRLERSLRR